MRSLVMTNLFKTISSIFFALILITSFAAVKPVAKGKVRYPVKRVQSVKPVSASNSIATKNVPAKPAAVNPHRQIPYVGAIAADANGRVLFLDNADRLAYPASVTKLMTLALILDDVRKGKYSLDDMVIATADVYRCEPSWVGIKVGEKMSVRDLLISLMVESANDAAIALGVHSAGSFEGFVARMNSKAKALGMNSTTYYNPNGLPPNSAKRYPWKSFNVSTARDQLKLAVYLLKMPEVLEFTSVKTCDLVKRPGGYRVNVTRRVNQPEVKTVLGPGESVVKQMRNHNNIMVKDKLKIFNPDGCEAVDGLKTGYIDAGGSSIVLTASRGKHRAIVVVLGSDSAKLRDEKASALMCDALQSLAF